MLNWKVGIPIRSRANIHPLVSPRSISTISYHNALCNLCFDNAVVKREPTHCLSRAVGVIRWYSELGQGDQSVSMCKESEQGGGITTFQKNIIMLEGDRTITKTILMWTKNSFGWGLIILILLGMLLLHHYNQSSDTCHRSSSVEFRLILLQFNAFRRVSGKTDVLFWIVL